MLVVTFDNDRLFIVLNSFHSLPLLNRCTGTNFWWNQCSRFLLLLFFFSFLIEKSMIWIIDIKGVFIGPFVSKRDADSFRLCNHLFSFRNFLIWGHVHKNIWKQCLARGDMGRMLPLLRFWIYLTKFSLYLLIW